MLRKTREEWLKTLLKRQTLWHRICYGNHIDILHEALTLDFCIFIRGELIYSLGMQLSEILAENRTLVPNCDRQSKNVILGISYWLFFKHVAGVIDSSI